MKPDYSKLGDKMKEMFEPSLSEQRYKEKPDLKMAFGILRKTIGVDLSTKPMSDEDYTDEEKEEENLI